MERNDTNLGPDSDTGITSGPLVVRQLFDPITHEAIKQFLDDRVPMMSVGVDETDFVRTYPWSSGFGTKYADPATLPATTGSSVAFSAAIV